MLRAQNAELIRYITKLHGTLDVVALAVKTACPYAQPQPRPRL